MTKELVKKEGEAQAPLSRLGRTLNTLTASLKTRLPAHVEPDVMIRAAVAAAQKTPKLLECSERSWILAMLNAAETGLIPNTAMQHAALVPFKGEVVFMPMYRGLIALARQSGEVDNISAHVVHSKDKYSVDFGTEEVHHEPHLADPDRGEPLFVYARAKLTGSNAVQFEVLTMGDVAKIRATSKSAGRDDSAWKLWPDEMMRKSAVKRLAKYLPMSTEKSKRFGAAISVDNQAETGEIGTPDLEPGELPLLPGEESESEKMAKELAPDALETTATKADA